MNPHELLKAVTGKKVPIGQAMVDQATNNLNMGNQPWLDTTWMGPRQPIDPQAQNVSGRQFDFPVGINLQYTPRGNEAVNFDQLRALADGYDILRLAIETRKDQMVKIPWAIQPIDSNEKDVDDPRIAQLQSFFRMPDRRTAWQPWLRQLIEDMLVIDAATVFPRMMMGGELYSLELLDGATIKRVIDEFGRTPLPPYPAYQQILKGVPAVDYTSDQLIYAPRNMRTWKLYGYSPVEQVVMTVNIAIRRQLSQLQYYTDGNIPDALLSVPETWNTNQIKEFQGYWDSFNAGNTANRRHGRFVPGGLKYQPTREPALKDEYDEWLARVVCYAFSLPPTPFIKQMNRATAETSQEAALQEGLLPLMQWVKDLMDMVIWRYFGFTDLCFGWREEKEQDQMQGAQINDIYVKAGIKSVDEVRLELGMQPIGMGNAVMTGTGPVMLDSFVNDNSASSSALEDDAAIKLEKGKKKVLKPINRNRHAARKAEKAFTDAAMKVFGEVGKDVSKQLAAKLLKSDSDQKDILNQVDEILNEIDLSGLVVLSGDFESIYADLAKDGAHEALVQLGISEDDEAMLSQVHERAVEWAKSRAAEMVGKRISESGELIDNPNAEWNILESTREMLRGAVTDALQEGITNDELADQIEEIGAGEEYPFSRARAEMIARTETANADVAGSMIGYRESGVVTGKQWILGEEACDECRENADLGVIGLDDIFPSGNDAPTAHPGCFLPGTKISAIDVSALFKRRFVGEIVIICSAGIDDIAVTPNHPILTDLGWIKAGDLKLGDNLVKVLNPSALASIVYPNHNHVESLIEDVPGALLMSGSVSICTMPISAEDFHGDGIANSEVSVVRTNSALPDDVSVTDEFDVDGSLGVRHFVFTGSDHLDANSFRAKTFKTQLRPIINAALAGHVSFVQITHIGRTEYDGRVYNLQTRDGWYVANGIIAHNCRCDILPVNNENDQ